MTRLDNAGTWIEHLRPFVGCTALTSMTVFEAAQDTDLPRSPGRVAEYVESRISDLPFFRCRIQRAPLGLGNCHLVPDPQFRIDNHIEVRDCPGRGSWRGLCDEVVRLRDEELDPQRPPWHITVLTNLRDVPGLKAPSGRSWFAVVTRIEHSVTDGAGSVAIARRLFPIAPNAAVDELFEERAETMAPGVLLDTALQVPNRLLQFARNAHEAYKRRSTVPEPTSRTPVVKAAQNPLQSQGGAPVYDALAYPVDEVKAIRSLVPNATINDVFLAVAGGALRSYLLSRGELPAESLSAALTIATRRREFPFVGNDFTMAAVPFWTNEKDPIERLQKVASSTLHMKNRVLTGPKIPLERALQNCPPVFIPRLLSGLSGGTARVAAAVVNVPRGSRPMYFGNAKSVASFGVPFTDGIPLAHAVSSLGSVLSLGVLYDNRALPDGERYVKALDTELGNLLSLAR